MIPSPGTPAASEAPAAIDARRGRRLVAGLLALALALAVFAVWFQWRQTRRCLGYYGAEQARRIQASPRVELWTLARDAPGGGPAPVAADTTGHCGAPDRLAPRPQRRLDVSRAPGLVHLRRGLVEDANFDWQASGPAGETDCWDVALAFYDSASAAVPAGVVLVGFAATPPEGPATASGRLAILGRPEVLTLGRLEAGLRTWVDATLAAAGPP